MNQALRRIKNQIAAIMCNLVQDLSMEKNDPVGNWVRKTHCHLKSSCSQSMPKAATAVSTTKH